jgi:hypothetical protein
MVQKAIRDCFYECTVLTIAHRLNTVIDCDRIMVMLMVFFKIQEYWVGSVLIVEILFLWIKCLEDGRVESFGPPYRLIRDKSSCFLASFLLSLDKAERERMVETARRKYMEQSNLIWLAKHMN